MQTLSYILSITSLVSIIISFLTKGEKMKHILFFLFLGNFLLGTSYVVGGDSINGAVSNYLGSIIAIINYFFLSKKKPIPKWLVAIYALTFITLNICISGKISVPVIFIILASLSYIAGIIQSSGIRFRFCSISNSLFNCLYDIVVFSYSALITHSVLLLFAILGLLFVDLNLFKNRIK